jgi:uncharacterized protein YjbI with pentapeptide repeats
LAGARFGPGTTLTGANFAGAVVRGANFDTDPSLSPASLLTLDQLYSTASYQARDLRGIGFGGSHLPGANLAGQDLADANFNGSHLPAANLSRANLANVNFQGAGMTGANLSHAAITNADFSGSATAIFDEWGEYVGADVVPGTELTRANLSGADARGANFDYAVLNGANTTNLIRPNGHVSGVDLPAGARLIVRDYDGNPAAVPPTGPVAIVVDQHLEMSPGGTLEIIFDANEWDSRISFAPGIAVTRGGTLELTFAPGVDPATQLGRTIDVFDWARVIPTGTFTIVSPYSWNLSELYITGEITLVPEPGGVALAILLLPALLRRRPTPPRAERLRAETASDAS